MVEGGGKVLQKEPFNSRLSISQLLQNFAAAFNHLMKGDVFVFPFGMIHFQMNLGHTPAVALSALRSQNPGMVTIANAVFGSNPRVSKEVLKRAFQVDDKVVAWLMAQFN
ncbi:germin-like protein 12-1 [Asparagus officinalis]|uniref:germin-like protein 12-1 n=1 Tax=Asparagus officinalis TaxID=4686 RepID=UPI00098E7744|nr:germin-like protein 12-1 [Asparagus officinalis]